MAFFPQNGRSCLILTDDGELVGDDTELLNEQAPDRAEPEPDTCLDPRRVAIADDGSIHKMVPTVTITDNPLPGQEGTRRQVSWPGVMVKRSTGVIEHVVSAVPGATITYAETASQEMVYASFGPALTLSGDTPRTMVSARPDSLSVTGDREGHRATVTTFNGRVESLEITPRGVRYHGLARVALPDGHQLAAATLVGERRYLVVTVAERKRYDTQFYREPPPIDSSLPPEWHIDNREEPYWGTATLWLAELPEASETPTAAHLGDRRGARVRPTHGGLRATNLRGCLRRWLDPGG